MDSNLIRAYEAETLDVKPGERAVIARVNTASVDRYNTVIEPGGIDLVAYRKNPVILWEHGKDPSRGARPIGRCEWIKLDRKSPALLAKTVFATDEYSDSIFRLYQEGCLKAFSVNVLPQAGGYGPPTAAERAARPELAGADTVYRKTELAEYSAVSVPGNSDALAIAVSRGLWVPDEVRDGLTEPSISLEELKAELGFEATEQPPVADDVAARLLALEAIDPGRPYESIHADLVGEIRIMKVAMLRHIEDMAALLRGRV